MINFVILIIRNYFNIIRNRNYSLTICSCAIDLANFEEIKNQRN